MYVHNNPLELKQANYQITKANKLFGLEYESANSPVYTALDRLTLPVYGCRLKFSRSAVYSQGRSMGGAMPPPLSNLGLFFEILRYWAVFFIVPCKM